jgi:serine/threonine-protein kinase
VPLEPGERIERYIIDGPLGSGGMGEVYRARDARLQRSVALKILRPPAPDRAGANPSAGAARMLREARAAAALEHPNVVAIYDVGEVETPEKLRGTTYLAMELVKGETLRAYVGDARVPMGERVRWLADVARALAAAHAAGLVHRDIKPENVMIREDGVVKVLDFGVAKRAVNAPVDPTSSTEGYTLPTMTGQGIVVGTPLYMAPEQLRAEALDFRADQFAWGVVAYELLTGKLPWNADAGGIALVAQILSAAPPPVPAEAGVPPHVVDVISRAMAKDRAARFASMDDLLAALDALGQTVPRMAAASVPPEGRIPLPILRLGAEAPLPAPLPAPEVKTARSRPPPPLRSRRALAGMGGAAAVLAIAAGAIVMRPRTQVPPVVAAPTAAAPDAATRACTHNSECVAKSGGKAAVCADGTCALVEGAHCEPRVDAADVARDDLVWFGAILPVTGSDASSGADGVLDVNALELARRDFAQAAASLRPPAGDSPVHPIGLIVCDEAVDPRTSAAHLVKDLKVPVVIGAGRSTLDLATSIVVPSDTLMVVPLSETPLLASVPHRAGQPRMVWRTTYNSAETGRAVAALVTRLERQHPGSGTRVALVRTKSPGAVALAEALFAALRFNGRSALENGDRYGEFSFDADPPGPEMAARVADFRPTIVISMVDTPFLAALDAATPAGGPRPFVIMPFNLDDEVARYAGMDPDRRRHVFGFTTVSNRTPNARFVVHYNETFAEPITRDWAPNTSYDAFYLAAYAAYALGRQPVSGTALAKAMTRLVPPGERIDVGTSGILRAAGVLGTGGHIDLNGATGDLDFDLQTGEAPVDFAVLCLGRGSRGEAIGAVESGLVFDSARGVLEGEARCP